MNLILLARIAIAFVAALALFVVPTSAAMGPAVVMAGDLEISGAFARATLPNAPVGGGFLTIANKGTTDDRLVSATSPAAGEVQLHSMAMDGNVMKMAAMPDGIAIPAGKTVKLTPDGLHLMFTDLKHPFLQGQAIPVTLTFEKAGTVVVQLIVAGIAAKAPPTGGSMMMMAPAMKPKS